MEKSEGTGERVGGYRVVRRLATGGTSDVLLAKAEGPQGFERSVVLKLLLSQYKNDEDFKGMFAREAAAYARLSHPSIVRLYDFFSNNDQLVMVLEYIDGPPLSRLRGMLKAVGQQFDDATSLYVVGSVFDALAAAHAANDDKGDPAPVIHRDVNPSNVLISWDGQVKLADFGIAKVTGVSHQSSAGLIKGTYGYMAPEQVKGESVTPRADVYAGAIVLWEMLTKRRAFIRGALPEIEVLRALADPRIVSIDVLRPDLDKNVRDAINRALEPRAAKRNITAEEMSSTLRSAVSADEGREKLARALASVRHDPKPKNTSMPPPMPTGAPSDEQATGKLFPRGLVPARPGILPRPTPAPRPAAALPRTTAPYGARPAPGSGGPPPQPRLTPPPSRAEAAPATSTPSDTPPATVAQPQSEPGLASILEPSEPNPNVKPSSRGQGASRPDVPVFDSLVEPRELVVATGRESEKLRLATPFAGPATGRGLRAAIDDILHNVPSNLPQHVFPLGEPGGEGGAPVNPHAATVEAPAKERRTVAESVLRELGQLPAAPAPMVASRPKAAPLAQNLAATLVVEPTPAKAIPSSFPAMNRTLAMTERPDLRPRAKSDVAADEKATERPPPQHVSSLTAPMPAVAPPALTPSTAKMRAFVVPQAALGSSPPPPGTGTGSSPPATLPLGALQSSMPTPLALPNLAATAPLGSPISTGSHSTVQGQPHSGPAQSGAAPSGPAPAGPPHSAPPQPPPQAAAQAAPTSTPAPQLGVHVGTVPPNRVSAPPASTRPPVPRLPVFALATVLIVSIAVGVAGTVGYVRYKKSHAVVATPPAPTSETQPPATAQGGPVATSQTSAIAASPASASASPTASASASASASPSASASASAPPVAAAEDVPPTMGRVKTAGAAPGRRIFVDERTVGQTPDAVLVKCGTRAIKLGSAGSTQSVDVPCGGEITLGDR